MPVAATDFSALVTCCTEFTCCQTMQVLSSSMQHKPEFLSDERYGQCNRLKGMKFALLPAGRYASIVVVQQPTGLRVSHTPFPRLAHSQ